MTSHCYMTRSRSKATTSKENNEDVGRLNDLTKNDTSLSEEFKSEGTETCERIPALIFTSAFLIFFFYMWICHPDTVSWVFACEP